MIKELRESLKVEVIEVLDLLLDSQTTSIPVGLNEMALQVSKRIDKLRSQERLKITIEKE